MPSLYSKMCGYLYTVDGRIDEILERATPKGNEQNKTPQQLYT